MRASACLQTAMAVAVSASPAIALVMGGDGGSVKGVMLRGLDCSKAAIDACVTSTGQESSACFGHLCADRPIETVAKRQVDNCTEENLLQCAILDWNEAQACFQQLCL
ncbi:hypothetical protein EKO27_g749 [Xylaria grammica]|uniref:Extracellular membrane protein CFEM domain-containing protein n=1 Tax=Xylaria grammica TaxID=363999 RepID=A0A439DJ47_9PEZI|nr:hypothetical protein F5X98DRAFT_329738 [Xylaria grammica]RWA14393.1 hypothetical protein EKO27_g749 [Xylaria grammica]GAW19849.1 hypothetical protein ANO14919_093400 [Xylariales sp. No.14919]